jgi:hypothetical protein
MIMGMGISSSGGEEVSRGGCKEVVGSGEEEEGRHCQTLLKKIPYY